MVKVIDIVVGKDNLVEETSEVGDILMLHFNLNIHQWGWVCDKLCWWWDIQIFDSFNVCDNSKVHDIIKAEKEANKEE